MAPISTTLAHFPDKIKAYLTRLEPVSRHYPVEKGIQGRIKDPLFIVGRQYQMSEFKQKKNGGHAARVNITYRDKELDQIKLSGNKKFTPTFEPYDLNIPLEKAVEQEGVSGDVNSVAKGWDDKRLEYQYSIGTSGVELVAEENFGFSDWFSFDLKQADLSSSVLKQFSFQPSRITFNGMPLPRWWSFEDRGNDLGNIRRPDLNFLTMILVEFSLLFKSSNFYLVPLNQKVGTLRKIESLSVVDSFGVVSTANPVIDKTETKQRWEIFTLHSLASDHLSDGRLFYYPNTLIDSLESAEQEAISFFRDEVSNLCWAVENYYVKEGKPFNRNDNDEKPVAEEEKPKPYYYWDLTTKTLVAPDEREEEQSPGSRYVGPLALYSSMKEMPLNWIPYQPGFLSTEGEYILRRSRTTENVSAGSQFHGVILSESKEIYEEEIPKVGIAVKRVYQLARDSSGNLCLWMGRKKVTDDKKQFSGLLFDSLIEK